MTAKAYETARARLQQEPKAWLVTGVAGFIGSHILETLLQLDQTVVGLDNFATGYRDNLEDVRVQVKRGQWARFRFIEGDICDEAICRHACAGSEIVLHQAALGSVPRSIEDPLRTHHANLTGFLNMLLAAHDAGVGRFVYATSSSTYGDQPDLPKVEDRIGRPLSPYAVTKVADELYADVFARTYGMPVIGLRYFNVFGARQDPDGAYAAVIPRWFAAMLEDADVFINGDGETSRDFCYIDNCVQANLLAATTDNGEALGQVFNVAFGEQTTLKQLCGLVNDALVDTGAGVAPAKPVYRAFRPGDVRHSLADIGKAQRLLGYAPEFNVATGLARAAGWYVRKAIANDNSGSEETARG
jgi:UDP-N-acetylglucosamine 4-epimerase